MRISTLTLIVHCVLACGIVQAQEPARRPNVLFLFTDDHVPTQSRRWAIPSSRRRIWIGLRAAVSCSAMRIAWAAILLPSACPAGICC